MKWCQPLTRRLRDFLFVLQSCKDRIFNVAPRIFQPEPEKRFAKGKSPKRLFYPIDLLYHATSHLVNRHRTNWTKKSYDGITTIVVFWAQLSHNKNNKIHPCTGAWVWDCFVATLLPPSPKGFGRARRNDKGAILYLNFLFLQKSSKWPHCQ